MQRYPGQNCCKPKLCLLKGVMDKHVPIDGRTVTQVYVDGALLDIEAIFCYLGDMKSMFSAGAGCSLAIITRCCTAWGKFKKLLPILTSEHISLTVRGKVFDACVSSAALLHGSETWARPLQTCNGSAEMTDQ